MRKIGSCKALSLIKQLPCLPLRIERKDQEQRLESRAFKHNRVQAKRMEKDTYCRITMADFVYSDDSLWLAESLKWQKWYKKDVCDSTLFRDI
jgi:hypothetical protein